MNRITEILDRNRHPLEPIATELSPQLKELPNIQAVLFDIYGTLLVSGSGDVGTAMEMTKGDALQAAWSACGVTSKMPADDMVGQFYSVIKGDHKSATKRGTSYPEIVVEEIWQKVFASAIKKKQVTVPDDFDPAMFALEFESRVNPVWPMPGLKEVIGTLQACGYALGIISNAQSLRRKSWNTSSDRRLKIMASSRRTAFFPTSIA